MFKVVPGNTCHFVSQLSQDEALINSIVAKLPTFDLQVRLNELLNILRFNALVTNRVS